MSGNAEGYSSAFSDWILQRLRKFASEGKVAQIFADDGTSWTYEELLRNSVHVASGLQSLGIMPGDRVSFTSRNCQELFAVVLGCVLNGVVVVSSVPEMPPVELRRMFLVIKPRVIISGEPFIPSVKEALNIGDVGGDFNFKPQILEIKQFFKDAISRGSHIDPATYEPARIGDPKTQPLCGSFSSGTTGKQKAVILMGPSFLRSVQFQCRNYNLISRDGPTFNPAQFNWISWWLTLTYSICLGWTRIFVNNTDVDHILGALDTYKVEMIFWAPFLMSKVVRRLDESPDRWDISALRGIVVAGDMLSKFAHERFATRFSNIKIYQSYGSTEVGVVIQSDINQPVVFGSVGKPVAPLKLVDVTTGKTVTKPNTPGEVVVEWVVMKEYADSPEETASVLDENGWFKTGDVATFDESGNYFIVDRKKAMFKHRGLEVYPSELEDIIMKLPGVKDAAVFGKEVDIELEYLPTAFIVKAENSDITEKDIHDCLEKEKLHDTKRLSGGVIFTDEIPRNANGKIIRAKLKELLNPL